MSALISNRVLLVLGAITRYTLIGLSLPLTTFSPSASNRNIPWVSLNVSSVTAGREEDTASCFDLSEVLLAIPRATALPSVSRIVSP